MAAFSLLITYTYQAIQPTMCSDYAIHMPLFQEHVHSAVHTHVHI